MEAELQEFIEQKVKSGAYPDADSVIQAAVAKWKTAEWGEVVDMDALDDETRAAIEEGLAQSERGEVLTEEELKQHLRDQGIRID